MPEAQFRPLYADMLAVLDPVATVHQLEDIGAGEDVALMCYEMPGVFCHRQMVAAWLKKELRIEVLEVSPCQHWDQKRHRLNEGFEDRQR
ncbi:MAG: DUF488 domain-containing protein [Gammaproteobacteria bacterium]|nr:DUF488 domain-containing protein [Gammaproteobacteria bacterium]